MDKIFDRFRPKAAADKKKNEGGGGGGINFFSFPGQNNNNKFQGQGKSLGGSKPGKVIEVELGEPGSLGIKVEKRPMGSAIVADVVPGSQAERAGLERGDILCFQGSNGQEEITYDLFLSLAKADQRPLCFEIRRITTKSGKGATTLAPEDGKNRSAESYARQQAVIAAAEKREREAKARNKKSNKDTKNNLPTLLSAQERRQIEEERLARMNAAIENQSEASREAVEAAKRSEATTAAQLGYNPYETNRVTAGQARNATVAATRGSMQTTTNSNGNDTTTKTATALSSTSAMPPLPAVRPPTDPGSDDNSIQSSKPKVPVSHDFEVAYETMVTSNQHVEVVNSFSVLRKLILNATTKGQSDDETQAAKFRKVRLSNAKIKAAIVDVEGAFDLMISVGFQLAEEEGESFLVYPKGFSGGSWVADALSIMEKYEKS
ncbi:hypothetical protein ACA910_004876 [Epithemia clementina (nom. ined.)]